MPEGTRLFDGGGEVGRDLAALDWSATPLGSPQHWPQSLRTAVRIVLTSRFSMWMGWGPDLIFFCNDAYRRDTLGTKYPWALGRPTREVWAEIWDDISPRIHEVMDAGQATWDEALLLFLERSGYPEETYHTFSYSPLSGDDGAIEGLLCVVSEDTERVVGSRRMATLQLLGADPTTVRTQRDALAAASSALGANTRSLPFTLLYLFDDDEPTAHLAAASGISMDQPAACAELDLRDAELLWPAREAAKGEVVVQRLDGLADLPCGPWPEPPAQALVVPLPQQGSEQPYGFLVAALNRYRPLDEGFRAFVQLVATQIAGSIGTARAYEEERQRAEALAELDRAKTTFFTNISHEFRTPLTLMLGPAEDAMADRANPLPEVQQHRVEVIHRNGQRLLRLVNMLLDFSRLESGRLDASFQPVDLEQVTRDLVGTFDEAFARAGLALTCVAQPLAGPIHVDPEHWAKIVLNLLSNALKFTFEGGVRVELDDDVDAALVRVVDTGIGVDPAQLPRLFERFHRVADARARTHEGSGIGLALVAELVALHGGTISVQSAPGVGTSFTIRLPYGSAHLPEDQVADSAAPPLAAPHAEGFVAEAMRWLDDPPPVVEGPAPEHGRRLRVLVADDNADMRDYIASLLRTEHEVELAPDGLVALQRAREVRPDLILTDVMMPNLDGFELLRLLRADPATMAIPVIMLSARAGEDGIVEGLQAGADDYLTKPFAARELRARVWANVELDRAKQVRDQLERSQRLLDQAQRLSGVGSWEADLVTGEITGSDEFRRQVELTDEELRAIGIEGLLELRLHPDDVAVARDAIAGAFGGRPFDYEARVVVPGAGVRTFRTIGELVRDGDGQPVALRGSSQDITDQRVAERELAASLAAREASEREHRIADELQQMLLPRKTFEPDHLDVSTFYRAGVEGTQVGGDWYDVIELGAGRTALVLGDVMGRGVRAAAVMGQLRSAVRAYARLDLPPADVLEFLDGVVRDLGDDHIVTCVYAVYDPADRTVVYANAGHLPPLVLEPGCAPQRLASSGPPLGVGPLVLTEQAQVLAPGALLVLYTDGLVENRDRDIDAGIQALSDVLVDLPAPVEELPSALVSALVHGALDDDIAVLVARVSDESVEGAVVDLEIPNAESVARARRVAREALEEWQVDAGITDDVVLLVSELVTNALVHGRGPTRLRLRRTRDQVVLEVHDTATFLPRRLRPSLDDEHGRGLQMVNLLADRWGTRPTAGGKAVWCVFSLR